MSADAWANGNDFRVRRVSRTGKEAIETIIGPAGESPTRCIVRDIIREPSEGSPTR